MQDRSRKKINDEQKSHSYSKYAPKKMVIIIVSDIRKILILRGEVNNIFLPDCSLPATQFFFFFAEVIFDFIYIYTYNFCFSTNFVRTETPYPLSSLVIVAIHLELDRIPPSTNI